MKSRYEQEAKTRKVLEFKMREIAMRPARGHHHHQRDRVHQSEDSKEPIPPDIPTNADYAQHENFISNINSSSYFNIPNPPNPPASPPKKDILFTGDTPLTSKENTSISADPSPALFTGATPLPSNTELPLTKDANNTSYLTAGTKSTPISVATSVGAFARSSTETSTSVDAEVQMEPKVVAATVNAIVEGGWRGEEARPPYPGITLLNMDKRPLGKCPSEKVLQIPSRSESALTLGDKRSTTGSGSTPTGMGTPENKISPVPVRRATTAHGYVLASLINNLSESDSRTNMGMKTDLSSDILGKRRSSDEVDVNIPCNKKTNQKRKRKRRSSKTVEAAGKEASITSVASTRSFFPYWVGRQRVFSKIEPAASSTTSTNKNQIAKVTTSEINVWEPNGSIRNRIASKESTKPSKESIRLAPPIQQPSLNVYELWKQAQGRKLGKILQETEKPPVTDQSRAQKAAVKAADK